MAANIFGRYVWLIDVLRRHKRLTFEEINGLWKECGLSYGKNDPFAKRTFHNHCNALNDIFNVEIKCDTRNGYKYYIDMPESLESDGLRSWLIDSYAMLNQVQCDKKLEGRILFENVPSGHTWLTAFTNAIRRNRVLEITHQGFSKPEPSTFTIEPYYLKVVKRRWYVVARSPYYSDRNLRRNQEDGGKRNENVYLIYALDRILAARELDEKFVFDETFDAEEYFRGCCGVIMSNDEPIDVVVKAYHNGAEYLRTLPLHSSQVELTEREEEEACYFKYNVCPTYDFYQAILEQADQIVVVEPESVRKELFNFAKNLMAYYKD